MKIRKFNYLKQFGIYLQWKHVFRNALSIRNGILNIFYN